MSGGAGSGEDPRGTPPASGTAAPAAHDDPDHDEPAHDEPAHDEPAHDLPPHALPPQVARRPAQDADRSQRLSVDRRMLETLLCPATQSRLDYDRAAQELISRKARLAYPIRDGIPVMLIAEARKLDD